MRVAAYYNEIDTLKAEILREAIRANAIAPGDVDERSIVDVEPADLMGYTQCHFFAGGAFWSLALRQAGWPDDRAVWTGSCPCPSFSAAGKGEGFADPRHLWPAWARLIRQCHPPTIFGEQVSAAIGHGWLDLVQTDLEAQNYAVGKAVLGACSVGAPHIRQRLYFVQSGACRRDGEYADRRKRRCGENRGTRSTCRKQRKLRTGRRRRRTTTSCGATRKRTTTISSRPEQCGDSFVMVDAEGRGLGMCGSASGQAGHTAQPSESGDLGNSTFDRNGTQHGESRPSGGQEEPSGGPSVSVSLGEPIRTRLEGHAGNGTDGNQPRRFEENALGSGAITSILGGMADSLYPEWRPFGVNGSDGRNGNDAGRQETHSEFGTCSEVRGASPVNGWWRDADWIGCRDGKFRPVEPGSQPLAHGSTARVGRLRLYGDAICVPAAQAFIESYLETERMNDEGHTE